MDPEFSDRVPESRALMSPACLGTRWACSFLRSLRLNYLKAPSSESVNPRGSVALASDAPAPLTLTVTDCRCARLAVLAGSHAYVHCRS